MISMSRTRQCELQRIPRLIAFSFPHKFNSLPLKQQTSASLTPPSSASSSSSPSNTHYPTISPPSAPRSLWSLWRHRHHQACGGPQTDSEPEDDQEEYTEGAFEELDDGSFAQREDYPPDRHADSEAEDQVHQSDHRDLSNKNRQKKKPSTVSDLSSLSDSQATTSQSTRAPSQSVPRKRQSTSKQPTKGKKKRKEPEVLPPNLPGPPLDDSSHSGRDRHRLQRAQGSMPVTTRKKAIASSRGGTGKPIGKGGSPHSKPNKKKRKHNKAMSDDDSSHSGSGSESESEGSYQSPSKKDFRKLSKKDMEKHFAQLQRELAKAKAAGNRHLDLDEYKQEQAGAELADKVVAKYRARKAANSRARGADWDGQDSDDDGRGPPGVSPYLKVGDPTDENGDMWLELYGIVLKEVYRKVKFINTEDHKDELCNMVMDHMGNRHLTLTGDPKKDASK